MPASPTRSLGARPGSATSRLKPLVSTIFKPMQEAFAVKCARAEPPDRENREEQEGREAEHAERSSQRPTDCDGRVGADPQASECKVDPAHQWRSLGLLGQWQLRTA